MSQARAGRRPGTAAARTGFAAFVALAALGSSSSAWTAEGFDLQRAVARSPAGQTIVVPAGVHRGPISIDRPLTLIAEPGAVIEGGSRGDVIRITASDVTLRGFTIRGTGHSLDQENAGVSVLAARATLEDNNLEDVLFGIYLKQAPKSTIRGNAISGKDLPLARRGDAIRLWYSPGCVIEANTVVDSRDVVIWFSDDVSIRDNEVDRGRYGLHFMYSDRNVIEGNRLSGNSVGAFLMYSNDLILRRNTFENNRGPSGYGIGLKDMDGVVASDNRLVANRVGVYLDNSPSSVHSHGTFVRNLFAHNDTGVAFQPSVKRNIFRENTFQENLEQVGVLGGGTFTGNTFTVDGRGNFWSDYVGYDLDRDGLGDLPYRAESLFENLMDRDPKLRLFLYSPAQQAIELAARSFPAVKPRPKLTDTAPLMAQVPPDLPAAPPAPRWPMGLVACLLLLSSVAAGAGGVRGRRGAARPGRERVADPPPTAPAAIEITGVTKRFGRFAAVDRLDLTVRAGEALALWGANGAGKTTLIRCLLGLTRFEGRIVVAGHDLRGDGKAARRAVGYVPQELALYDDWRARDVLTFFARLKRVPASRVHDVLGEVSLEEHSSKRVGSLSGGMKQRLALAAALLADPPILVLDEITSNLDSAARHGLLHLLHGQIRAGKTVLFTSHRRDEVVALADRVLVLDQGRAKQLCTPREFERDRKACLELRIADGTAADAAALLADRGFQVRSNGAGIFVRVDAGAKTEPLRILFGAGFAVSDFGLDREPSSDEPEPGPRSRGVAVEEG